LIFTIALLIHVLGAIVGLGPTVTFSVLGPMAGKAGPNGGVALMEAMVGIERRFVTPVALFTQPLSGVVLIFSSGWDRNFFSHQWLWISILLFIGILYGSYFVNNPALARMIAMAKAGEVGKPEFAKAIALTQKTGPLLTVSFVAIIFLMVLKPGG
jgi:uncharacterized membrane protein